MSNIEKGMGMPPELEAQKTPQEIAKSHERYRPTLKDLEELRNRLSNQVEKVEKKPEKERLGYEIHHLDGIIKTGYPVAIEIKPDKSGVVHLNAGTVQHRIEDRFGLERGTIMESTVEEEGRPVIKHEGKIIEVRPEDYVPYEEKSYSPEKQAA